MSVTNLRCPAAYLSLFLNCDVEKWENAWLPTILGSLMGQETHWKLLSSPKIMLARCLRRNHPSDCTHASLRIRPQCMYCPLQEASCGYGKLLANVFPANQRWSFCVCCDIKPHFRSLWIWRAAKRSRNELNVFVKQKSTMGALSQRP